MFYARIASLRLFWIKIYLITCKIVFCLTRKVLIFHVVDWMRSQVKWVQFCWTMRLIIGRVTIRESSLQPHPYPPQTNPQSFSTPGEQFLCLFFHSIVCNMCSSDFHNSPVFKGLSNMISCASKRDSWIVVHSWDRKDDKGTILKKRHIPLNIN